MSINSNLSVTSKYEIESPRGIKNQERIRATNFLKAAYVAGAHFLVQGLLHTRTQNLTYFPLSLISFSLAGLWFCDLSWRASSQIYDQFIRYANKNIYKNIVEQQNSSKDVALIIHSYELMDYTHLLNGSFYKQIVESLKSRNKVIFKIAHDVDDANQFIQEAQKQGTLKTLIMTTQGKKESMKFGSSTYINASSNQLDFSGLDKDAKIILNSCGTGQPEGIAETIAKLAPGRAVFAPTGSGYPTPDLTVARNTAKGFSLQFLSPSKEHLLDEEGTLNSKIKFTEEDKKKFTDITRVYWVDPTDNKLSSYSYAEWEKLT